MPEACCAINTFCTKQPVLDAEQQIHGYAFSFQRDPQDQNAFTSVADSLQGAVGKDKAPIKLGMVFSAQAIIDGLPYALDPEHTLIELAETADFSDALLNSLNALRKKKYSIALNALPSAPFSPELARIAHVLKVDMVRTNETERAALADLVRDTRTTLLAKRVNSHALFLSAQKDGFSLFQGFFFQQSGPQAPQRSLTSLESTRLRLFRILQSPEPDFGALGEVIQADVSLSYRLLSLLNSPAFRLVRRIESVGQALVLLGWQQLKSWLLVVILSDLMAPEKCPELVINSAQRAKFFELAAHRTESPYAPETLFLLGLFSLLEPLMDVPMARIADNLPLEDGIKDALCGKTNDCSQWLALAAGFEKHEWDLVKQLLAELQLETLEAANAYHAANLWANTMLTLF